MRKLLMGLAVVGGLAAGAWAQWGRTTVPDEADVGNIVASQFKIAQLLPHQIIRTQAQDTTITSAGTASGGAHKIIAWDDRQPLYNCVNFAPGAPDPCAGSYPAARIRESSNSWVVASRGDTADYCDECMAEITVGKDSLVLRNYTDGKIHMVFETSGTGEKHINSTVTDVIYLDRRLYVTGSQLSIIDFQMDKAWTYAAGSRHNRKDNIQNRNADNGNYQVSSIGIADNSTNAVAVTRDVFGIPNVDRGYGPAHWWGVVMQNVNNAWSQFDPHDNAITDRVAAIPNGGDILYGSKGRFVYTFDGTTYWAVFGGGSGFADNTSYGGPGGADWATHQTGANGLAWSDPAATPIIKPIFGKSIAGHQSDLIVAGADQGVYLLHTPPSNTAVNPVASDTYQARQRLSTTVNAPIEIGDGVLALALEDNTTDSSPYGNTMTAVGTPGSAIAIFGQGYSSTTDSHLKRTGDSDFNVGTGDWTISFWYKSASATNPAAAEALLMIADSGDTDYIRITVATDGSIDARITDDGGATADEISPGADIYDNIWHHIVFTRGGAGLQVYIDGVEAGTATVSNAAASIDPSEVWIGSNSDGNWDFNGFFDDFVFSKTHYFPEQAAAIHAEGRRNINAPTITTDDGLYSNSVVAVDARHNHNGDWIVAFSDAQTAMQFNGRVLVDTFALDENLKGAAFLPDYGQDSAAVVIYGATKTRIVRPSVTAGQLAAFDWHSGQPKMIHTIRVDSSGHGDFWSMDDAIDAGKNADVRLITVANGTYGGWTLDQSQMVVECDSPKFATTGRGVMFDGKGVAQAVNITGGQNIIKRCGFYTAPGGAGGGYSAVEDDGDGNTWLIENVVIDSDDQGIGMNGVQSLIWGNRITGADADGIHLDNTGDLARALNNWVNAAGGDGIEISTNAENCVVVGNLTEQAITDNSGTSTVTGNEDF